MVVKKVQEEGTLLIDDRPVHFDTGRGRKKPLVVVKKGQKKGTLIITSTDDRPVHFDPTRGGKKGT